MSALEGGRTAITTEALVAYNNLRQFAGLRSATLDDVGNWAFANSLTNNAQAWDNDLQEWACTTQCRGQGRLDRRRQIRPQIVADIERTARLGSATDVMAMVEQYGHPGYAQYLMDNGCRRPSSTL